MVDIKDDKGKVIAKVENKETAYWLDIEKKVKAETEGLEKALKFNKAILKMVGNKVLESKR
jgi:predicted nucleic-acid-binding protein